MSTQRCNIIIICRLKQRLILSPDHDSQMYVNEDQNFLAEEAVNGAVAYVNKNESFGISVNITRVITNRTESVELLQALCRTYASMLETSTPPHLVLDTTLTGLSSETVKSFTASLGLPTITASFGQERDLIKWRNIDDDEKKYMIQINPPNDIIPQVIKHIVKKQNITNAAVIFDSSFVMEHKYKSLFQNIATRNVITSLNEAILSVQIQQLMALDLVNFFILGRIKTLNTILNYASEIDILKKKYAWHFITSDTANLTCNCKNWSQVLHVKPLVDSTEQEALIRLKNIYNMESIAEITSVFYFDFALRSFLTVRSMLINGTWTRGNSEYITCDDYTGENTPRAVGFDLRSAFIEV
ncbi:hypothetical protein WA026_007380 [Henosepilachna vigintioctopunctata]|uniref:Uncharacterized protein n=1 Tax=Henosepilachna vigintioctopunctata TaxID=420089 RepID=A0AAW1UN74_9CUCU